MAPLHLSFSCPYQTPDYKVVYQHNDEDEEADETDNCFLVANRFIKKGQRVFLSTDELVIPVSQYVTRSDQRMRLGIVEYNRVKT